MSYIIPHPLKVSFRKKEVHLVAHLLFVACFLMWGGIGLFDTAQSPEIAGALKYQDVLVLIGGSYLVFLTLRLGHFSKNYIIVTFGLLTLISWGVLVGVLHQNGGRNIALELRPLLYTFLGVALASLMSREKIAQNITGYSVLAAIAILIQFLIFLRSGRVFVNGVVPGNVNSINLPVVRPQSFHLITIGLIFTYSGLRTRNRLQTGIITAILMAALLIMQSKTYWGLAAFAFLILFLFDKSLSIRVKTRLGGALFLGGLFLIFITTPLVNKNNQDGGNFVVKKITDIFADTQVAYRVVGVRLDEGSLMLDSWRESPATILFGQGLGYLYRDLNLFYYRADLRDQERLAMFGHNYYLWLLLKLGLVGMIIFGGLATYTFANTMKRSYSLRRHFALAIVVMLTASMFLGTVENPLGGFLFGLLLFGAIKSEDIY
ncbi:MAG: hypothetical protein H6662_05075 [Ardenticatenaceae bacterium]|nr:hypothetical protein [Anaerolineales bacterium]MCB8920939.1 hypothetical protein [Ardenticatenaceae bacterium]